MTLRLTAAEGEWLRRVLLEERARYAAALRAATTDAEQIRQHADMDLCDGLVGVIDEARRRKA